MVGSDHRKAFLNGFRSSERALGFLFCLLAFANGCVSHHPKWAEPASAGDILLYAHSREAASLLALPGDMVLPHIGHSEVGKALSQLAVIPASLTDVPDFQDPITSYLHSEVVTNITAKGTLKTNGYYPLVKQYTGQQFGGHYAVCRLRNSDLQARAPDKVAHEHDLPLGYCGDYMAWAYDKRIYSGWNRIPLLQPIMGALYPPSAIHTPDSLAQSPETELICEVFAGEILYPLQVKACEVRQAAQLFAASSDATLAAHARRVPFRQDAYAPDAVITFQKMR